MKKIRTNVEIPLIMNMAPYFSGPGGSANVEDPGAQQGAEGTQDEGQLWYELYAVANHFGGYGGGHYTANCKFGEGVQQWYNCNDTTIRKIAARKVSTKDVYMCFFRRIEGTAEEVQQRVQAVVEAAESEENYIA